MSVQIGEIGRIIRVGTDFDLSGSTSMELEFKILDPVTGVITTVTIPTARITAPGVDSPLIPEINAVLPANTYMQFTTDGTEWTEGGSGTYTVRARYQDATPIDFYGSCGSLYVGEGCTPT